MAGKYKIGWIGLGKMGFPMSRNLIKAGYELRVYDIVDEKVNELKKMGAIDSDSLKELAANSYIVISMIPNDSILKKITTQPDGIFGGTKPKTIYIDMSTVSPAASKKVSLAAEAKNISYLRAPVSGSTALAADGKLTILASGPKGTFDKCRQIFNVLGKKTFYVGQKEEARYLKLVLNIMVGLNAAIVAEALSFGNKGGINWNQMIDIIAESVVSSPLFMYKVKALKERDFTPAFTANQMIKDLDLALKTGKELESPLPMISMVRKFLKKMSDSDKGENDFFGLVEVWGE